MNGFASTRRSIATRCFDDVIPFWERHSLDREVGGYFTCLDRDGSGLRHRQVRLAAGPAGVDVLDALQPGRSRGPSGWRWRDTAPISCAPTACDADGNWYFALDRAGQPAGPAVQHLLRLLRGDGVRPVRDPRAATPPRRTWRARRIATSCGRHDNPKGSYIKAVSRHAAPEELRPAHDPVQPRAGAGAPAATRGGRSAPSTTASTR